MPEKKKKKGEKYREYILEDILKSTEEIIQDIESENLKIEKKEKPISKEKKDILEEIYLEELKELEKEKSEVIHGYAEIFISEDEMEVAVDFYPPMENGMPLELDDVKHLLDSNGVVHGIDWDTILHSIEKCNNERTPVLGVTIARGTEPEDEVPEHIVIEPHLLQPSKQRNTESHRVDFKEFTSYTLVKKGETIARIVPRKEGKFGKTVKGEFIPYQTKNVKTLQPGKNTVVEGNRIVAACDGRLDIKGNSFWVSEVFEVYGDVNYKTGNIKFPGDIIIHGRVNDGFKVESGGTIICKQTLDASEVVCDGDLIIDKGIIGRQKGRVKVGGIISAKFIENCWVEAEDSIYIETGVLHSIIYTHNKVEMSKNGIIVGGKIFAQNGVSAGQIGTKMGIKTEIHCGIDYDVQKRMEWIKEKTMELASKLNMINDRINKREKGYEKLIPIKEKVMENIHKLNEAAKNLVFYLDKNENAEVVVHGTVYPGVYIEICHVSYLVPRELMHVHFWLDKERGKVQVGPI